MTFSWVRWLIPVITALLGLGGGAKAGGLRDFEASLGYRVRPHIIKLKTKASEMARWVKVTQQPEFGSRGQHGEGGDRQLSIHKYIQNKTKANTSLSDPASSFGEYILVLNLIE